MIAVQCSGRLGNQMFEYAFGVAAARRLGTSFLMWRTNWGEDEQLSRFFVLGTAGASLVDDTPPYPVVEIDHVDFDEPEDVLAALRDDTIYKGFFQSER